MDNWFKKNLEFEWDEGNADKNWIKHKVFYKEAEEAFNNKPLYISLDEKHSKKFEKRLQALGKTNEDRLLFLAFTIRNNKVRVISVRPMSKKEKKVYEKKQTVKTNS